MQGKSSREEVFFFLVPLLQRNGAWKSFGASVLKKEDFLNFCMELSSPGKLITQQMLIHSRESIFTREDNYTEYIYQKV